jgi:hypothetical protein
MGWFRLNDNITKMSADNIWFFDGGNTSGVAAYKVSGGNNLYVYVGAAYRTFFTLDDTNFAPGTWHHLAVTWDTGASKTYLYLDGVHVTSGGLEGYGTPTDDAGGWDIGSYGTGYQFPGLIDDAAILDRAIGVSEVRAVYESGAPIFAETSTFAMNTPGNRVTADDNGLFAIDSTGGAVLGISSVDGLSWGGSTLDSGDVLIGSGTTHLLWDQSAADLKLSGAGGNVILDTNGLTLTAGIGPVNSVGWLASGTNLGYVQGYTVAGGVTMLLGAYGIAANPVATTVLQANGYSTGTCTLQLDSAGGVSILGTVGKLAVSGGFGCNGKTAQTAYASGGAAPAGGTGTAAGGWDTAAHRDSAITLLNNIRTALVNAGIMS